VRMGLWEGHKTPLQRPFEEIGNISMCYF